MVRGIHQQLDESIARMHGLIAEKLLMIQRAEGDQSQDVTLRLLF
jgi:hypothetical protein